MVLESVKSLFTAEKGGGSYQYECNDCGGTFESDRTKQDARCPDCGGIPSPE